MTAEETRDATVLLDKTIGLESYMLLRNYERCGLQSRNFLLPQVARMIGRLHLGKGHYSKYTAEQLAFVQGRAAVEIASRTCALLEDFCAIADGLSNDPKNLLSVVLSQGPPKRLLSVLERDLWQRLFRYRSLDDLPLRAHSKKFVNETRSRNLDYLEGLAGLLTDFHGLYWVPYNKHKHANGLLYGLDAQKVGEEDVVFVPVFYNRKKPSAAKAIPVTRAITRALMNLHARLFTVTRDVVTCNLLYAERGGVGFVQYNTYVELLPKQRRRLRDLQRRVDKDLVHSNIDLQMKFDCDLRILSKHSSFAARCINLNDA